jgi:hypothetical protein
MGIAKIGNAATTAKGQVAGLGETIKGAFAGMSKP